MRAECYLRLWDTQSQSVLETIPSEGIVFPPTMRRDYSGYEVRFKSHRYSRGLAVLKAFWMSVNTFHKENGRYLLTATSSLIWESDTLPAKKLEVLQEFGVVVYPDQLLVPPRIYSEPDRLRAFLRAVKALIIGEPISERDRKTLSTEEASASFYFIHAEKCGWPICVEFSDEWNSTQMDIFQSLLQRLETTEPIKVIFYGLRKSRGEVWAIPTAPEKHRLQDEFPKPVWEGNTLNIGVPYSFRKEKIDIAFLKEVLGWIRQTLSDRGVLFK